MAERLFSYNDVFKLLRSDFDGIAHVDVFSVPSRIAFRGMRDEHGRIQKEDITIHSISKRDYLHSMRKTISDLQSNAKVHAIRAKLIWLAKYFNQSLDPEDGIEPIPVNWGEQNLPEQDQVR
jgi:hypothetical protein